MYICELIKMYSFKSFSYEKVYKKPQPKDPVLALIVM